MKHLTGVAALAVVVLGASCGHIVHPAEVTPGWTVAVLPGANIVRHEPRSDATNPALVGFEAFRTVEAVLQLNVAYGWRFSDHLAFQIASSAGVDSAPTVAPYVQLLGRPLDIGLGATLSLNGRTLPNGFVPGVYGLIGKAFAVSDKRTIRLDAGARWFRIHDSSAWQTGYGPTGLASLEAGGFSVGLWGDHVQLSGPVLRSLCSDNCGPDDLQASGLSFGAFVRVASGPTQRRL